MESLIIQPNNQKELELLLLLLHHLKIKSQLVDTTKIEKEQLNKKKGVNTLKYCGIVNFSTNPVELQRKWRDDWR